MSNDPSHMRPAATPTSDRVAKISPKDVEPSPTSRQQRLLRMRNDRFPVKTLPVHSFNPRSRSAEDDSKDSSPPTRSPESIAVSKPRLYQKNFHSTSSLSILQEISNSIRSSSLGVRAIDKRHPIPIFQDTPERALLDPSPNTTSPFSDPSPSPTGPLFHFNNIQDSINEMGLRDITGNARKVSAQDSPVSSGAKHGRRRPISLAAGYDSEEYIQHIERELELAHESVYSPNSNRSWKDKMKAAQAENERLRRELANTKANFEAEVQNAVQHKTAAEVILRRRIRSLEEEAEHKDNTIRDLELKHDEKRLNQGTVETLKATIDRLDGEKAALEHSNHTMSKRNEILTHLLALSPTKSQQTFDLQETPIRTSKSSRHGRPKSLLLPRVSSSPTHTHPHRPQSLVTSPVSCSDFEQSPHAQTPGSPGPAEVYTRFPFRPDLLRSQSVQQDGRFHSRSSTLASCMSMSPNAEHRLSSSSSMSYHTRRTSNRGSRRCVPGSTQLKPLLLPTLTGEFGALNSTSPVTSPSKPPRHDFTDEAVDPAPTFMSKSPVECESEADSAFDDSPYALAQRESARHLAYQSLEGVLDAHGYHDVTTDQEASSSAHDSGISNAQYNARNHSTVIKSPTSVSSGDDPDKTILPAELMAAAGSSEADVVDNPNERPHHQTRAYSSPANHAVVEVPEPLFSPKSKRRSVRSRANPYSTKTGSPSPPSLPLPASIPRKRRKISSSSIDREDGAERPRALLQVPQKGANGNSARSGRSTPSNGSRPPSLSLLSPRGSRGPLELLQSKNFGVRPIAVVTIKTIYGTLSKCTAIVRDFKKDPLALARRVIANAWRCNWAVMGKLSWWVLGLFLGPSAKDPRPASWNWDDYDGEAIAERHCRRKSKRLSAEQQSLLTQQAESRPKRRVAFKAPEGAGQKSGSKASQPKAGWTKSVLLWAKFSTAIVLAVGGAVVKGPGEMLKETDKRRASRRSRDLRRTSTASDESDLSSTSAVSIEMQDMSPRPRSGELRQRRPRRASLVSPPPSARALLARELDADMLSSSPPVSSSPAFASWRFGRGQRFAFDIDPDGVDIDTLRPPRAGRINIEDIFDYSNAGTPTKVPGGDLEYDPESAGLGRFRSTASTPDSLK